MIYNKELSQVTLWLLNAEFGTIHIEGQTIRVTRPWVNGKGYQREDAEEYIRDIL